MAFTLKMFDNGLESFVRLRLTDAAGDTGRLSAFDSTATR